MTADRPMCLPCSRVSGTAVERGRQIGVQHRQQIAHSLKVYRHLFAHCAIPWREAVERSLPYREETRRVVPEILQELNGLASGAGVDVESLFVLHARTELLPADFRERVLTALRTQPAAAGSDAHSPASPGRPPAAPASECTALAITATRNDVWLAQNWDWIAAQRQALCAIETCGSAGPAQIRITEAGMLAKIGMNAHGLGIALNILRSALDGNAPGLPIHILLRALLDCTSVSDARRFIGKQRFAGSSNVLLVDAGGDSACVEISPAGTRMLAAESGVLCHTNHFLHPSLQKHDIGCIGNPSTYCRLSRIRRHVGQLRTWHELCALLGHTGDGEHSIYRSPERTLPELARLETLCSVIMKPRERRLWVSTGPPSSAAWTEWRLH